VTAERAVPDSGELALRLSGSLHALNAADLCAVVSAHACTGISRLVFECDEVTSVDVAGVAALLQSVRRLEASGVKAHVRPSAALFDGLLEASVLDDLPTSNAPAGPTARTVSWRAQPAPDPAILARTDRVALRIPTKEDLELFELLATEPLLDRMVGSHLLYLCRHLGPRHPTVISQILDSPSSVTALIDPVVPGFPTVGFVRLFGIDVAQGFGFIETVVADMNGFLKGWGVEASRLMVAYGQDALGLRRVEAKTYAYNKLSINAVRRNGFREEGVLRQACVRDGREWDVRVFSILSDEMRKERGDQFPYMGFWSESSWSTNSFPSSRSD
jgi:anti-anti-sigma regulatory factor